MVCVGPGATRQALNDCVLFVLFKNNIMEDLWHLGEQTIRKEDRSSSGRPVEWEGGVNNNQKTNAIEQG